MTAEQYADTVRALRHVEALLAENQRLWNALDFIASDATITPEGCPEPWRSTLIEWAQAANHVLTRDSEEKT
jgi:hypothetical protein